MGRRPTECPSTCHQDLSLQTTGRLWYSPECSSSVYFGQPARGSDWPFFEDAVTLADLKPTTDRSEENTPGDGRVDVGILTKGKPTLGMALTSLLLQDEVSLRIHVVDTSARPVINRDDVRFAFRLAGDRQVHCSYEYSGESDLAFSNGKARLIRALSGSHLCLMDDDVVMPARALRQLLDTVHQSPIYGYVSPFCRNSPALQGHLGNRPPCSPGSLIYQDGVVRRILTEYYETTIDVLDRRKSDQKVWETAFLTALFDVLDRPQIRQADLVTYHLDYQEDSQWIDEERTVIARSAAIARDLAKKARAEGTVLADYPVVRSLSTVSPRSVQRSWARRARQVLSWVR